MLFAKKIIRLSAILFLVCFLTPTQAQINSPFSRYGLGNEIFNNQNAASQGMGGFTTAFTPSMNGSYGQSVNFNNPATYGSLYLTTFDLGINFNSFTLKRNNPVGREKSNYLLPDYIAIGVPINKMKKIGMAFGLRPLTQINYSVIEQSYLSTTRDTLLTQYKGDGGLNQLFFGAGKSWKYVSLGFNTGYNFGRKKIEAVKSFNNSTDSNYFYQTLSSTNTMFGGVFFKVGLQSEFPIKTVKHKNPTERTEYSISLGATANFAQNLNGKQDILRTTGIYTDVNSAPIDTASSQADLGGTIKLPATYNAGIAFHKREITTRAIYDQWVVGLEYSSSAWKDNYQFYGQKDLLSNSWMLRLGGQFCPNPNNYESYWSTVVYRLGFFNGKDYANIDNNGLKVSGVTLGMGLPIRKYRSYDYQYTVLNLAMQFGQRGTSVNNFSESYIQFTLGYSLSDIWFNKRKYD
ncbi:MAG: hypothetical protein WCP61_01485 [Chitinophagia bacterium]|jgi:hypothetical protein